MHDRPAASQDFRQRLADWIHDDPDGAVIAVGCFVLGISAFSGSASHILRVGAYPTVHVTNWLVWTVAGSLEALAALATWELRHRSGIRKMLPGSSSEYRSRSSSWPTSLQPTPAPGPRACHGHRRTRLCRPCRSCQSPPSSRHDHGVGGSSRIPSEVAGFATAQEARWTDATRRLVAVTIGR